ncbi:MAG: hypothetical protein KDA45_10785, partial [Planctomycetales bacterium]|nr:hypothetical protein [Planctomycetales bacterium]
MNVIEKISKLRTPQRRPKANSRVAVVHWDRETIDYLVVTPKSSKLAPRDMGRVSRAEQSNPLVALAEYFREHSIAVQRLIVLLSRPALEQLQVTLPPAEESELPALVAAEVEQQLGDTEEPPIVDFYRLPTSAMADEAVGSQALAFSLPVTELDKLRAQSSEAGFRLTAVGSRDLSPLGILRRRNIPEDSLTVSVHLYASEAELAICRGAEPLFLRLIRVNTEDPQRVAEQIWMESQRCLTLLPAEIAELPQGWFVFTTCDAAWKVARALEDREVDVQPVDPLIGWELHGKLASEPAEGGETQQAYSSAANAGAAWEFLNGVLPINLLEPKKSPVPPNPLYRWVGLGLAATAAIGLAVYFMLADLRQLRDEVAGLESELADSKKLAAKFQEKADQVAVVESWLADQVDWLDELNELSSRLPDGQNATVRRLTASANGSRAVVDLSVQVAKQENISQLENRIRSAKYDATSKRISQNADSAEYPWQFETHVSFAVERPNSELYASSAAPPAADSPAADSPAADSPAVAALPAAASSAAAL